MRDAFHACLTQLDVEHLVALFLGYQGKEFSGYGFLGARPMDHQCCISGPSIVWVAAARSLPACG
jgi:hypothetical protein